MEGVQAPSTPAVPPVLPAEMLATCEVANREQENPYSWGMPPFYNLKRQSHLYSQMMTLKTKGMVGRKPDHSSGWRKCYLAAISTEKLWLKTWLDLQALAPTFSSVQLPQPD